MPKRMEKAQQLDPKTWGGLMPGGGVKGGRDEYHNYTG